MVALRQVRGPRRPHRATGRPRGRPPGSTNLATREPEYRKALAKRGVRLAKEYLEELVAYLMQMLAQFQSFNEDGSPREGGDEAKFVEYCELMMKGAGLLMPYQSPRLASVTVRHETAEEEPQEYATIEELRARLIKRGLPVDHLVIRHEPSAVEEEHVAPAVEEEHVAAGGAG
jgi:hypothetical protein